MNRMLWLYGRLLRRDFYSQKGVVLLLVLVASCPPHALSGFLRVVAGGLLKCLLVLPLGLVGSITWGVGLLVWEPTRHRALLLSEPGYLVGLLVFMVLALLFVWAATRAYLRDPERGLPLQARSRDVG